MSEKYIEYLDNAGKTLRTADHLIYVTFPLIKEKKLLLKVLDEMRIVLLNIINAVLQYEYLYKRIRLFRDSKDNFNTFVEKCAQRYDITALQIEKIKEILRLVEKHKKSPMEFIRRDKIVIMSDSYTSLRVDTITLKKIKDFLANTKDIFRKVKVVIGR